MEQARHNHIFAKYTIPAFSIISLGSLAVHLILSDPASFVFAATLLSLIAEVYIGIAVLDSRQNRILIKSFVGKLDGAGRTHDCCVKVSSLLGRNGGLTLGSAAPSPKYYRMVLRDISYVVQSLILALYRATGSVPSDIQRQRRRIGLWQKRGDGSMSRGVSSFTNTPQRVSDFALLQASGVHKSDENSTETGVRW